MNNVQAFATTLLACVAFSTQATAEETIAAFQAARIADSVTLANLDPQYQVLLHAEYSGLVEALRRGTNGQLSQESVDKAVQGSPLADNEWLNASGYSFARREAQEADIKVLAPFITLPRWQLLRSDVTTSEINRQASPEQQGHAVFDADAIAYLFFIPEALGPKLGRAFLEAYQAGEIGKAAALIKASEVSTGPAKDYFNYPRPFLIDHSAVRLVPDDYVLRNSISYTGKGGAFPSGHTNTGFTDCLLLAQMLPERFVALINRAAGYGYSRIVLGVHYPLDVIGSRIIVARNLTHLLKDPAYQKLFGEAQDQLRAALEIRCGVSLAECAKPTGTTSDPWTAPAMRSFYDFTMTYLLPQSRPADVEMQVPEGAEVLLSSVAPTLSTEERKAILGRTALGSGFPLDSKDVKTGFWQRLNLHEAALAAQAQRETASEASQQR